MTWIYTSFIKSIIFLYHQETLGSQIMSLFPLPFSLTIFLFKLNLRFLNGNFSRIRKPELIACIRTTWEYKHHNCECPLLPSPFPELLLLSMTSYGVIYPFGQLRSVLPAVSPLSLLLTLSLLSEGLEWDKKTTLYKRLSNSQNTVVLSRQFESEIQKTALDGLKLTPRVHPPKIISLMHSQVCSEEGL